MSWTLSRKVNVVSEQTYYWSWSDWLGFTQHIDSFVYEMVRNNRKLTHRLLCTLHNFNFLFHCLCPQGYYPSNKPGVEPRRPCRPVNITPWLHLSNVTNRVTVTWGNFGKVRVKCSVTQPWLRIMVATKIPRESVMRLLADSNARICRHVTTASLYCRASFFFGSQLMNSVKVRIRYSVRAGTTAVDVTGAILFWNRAQ